MILWKLLNIEYQRETTDKWYYIYGNLGIAKLKLFPNVFFYFLLRKKVTHYNLFFYKSKLGDVHMLLLI